MIPNRLLNTVLTILKRQGESDSWGSSASYAEGVSMPCRIQPVSSREYVHGKTRGEATHKLFVNTCEEIRTIDYSDKLRIGGKEYGVVGLPEDAAGHGDHYEIYLKEIL